MEMVAPPPVRIVVLGLSNFLLRNALPGLQRAQGCKLVGVAVRDLRTASTKLGGAAVGEVLASYDEALARPDVDAVYVTLPNALHVEWTLRAIDAGKHVLCEKPLALNPADVDRVAAAAEAHGITVLEGVMYRFHPQWRRIGEILRSGEIGEVRTVMAHYAYLDTTYNGPRFHGELGGGALRMVGCYPINIALFAFNHEPHAVTATSRPAGTTTVDGSTSALIEFAGGHATITATTEGFDSQYARIVGTSGIVEVLTPINAPPGQPVNVILRTSESREKIDAGPVDQFERQFQHFAEVVHGLAKPSVTLRESRQSARVLEAVAVSADQGGLRIELDKLAP
jgi:predicted dehydrogenase